MWETSISIIMRPRSLHHLEGNNFDLWNHRMREHLIRTQEKDGEFKGSWKPDGVPHGNTGGRLYVTSLSMLTLQSSLPSLADVSTL